MEKISTQITDWCRKYCDLDEQRYETVQYGIEVFLNTFLKLFILLVIGIILHRLWETLLVLGIFGILRKYAGGYHCKTHVACLGSMLLISFCPVMFEQLNQEKSKSIWITMMIYAVYMFWRYAPRNSMVNPICDAKILRNKRLGSRILCGVVIILFLFLQNSKIRWLLLIPFFAEAVTISALFWNRKERI